MAKLMKKRSKKIGLPPGALVHIGEGKAAVPRITIIDYDETRFEEKEVRSVEECFSFRDTPTVTWINVDGVHQIEIIEKLGHCFGLHPLVMEDILNTDQRPKMEVYGDYLYIVLKMLYVGGTDHRGEGKQVRLILGSNFEISFQEEKEGDVFNSV